MGTNDREITAHSLSASDRYQVARKRTASECRSGVPAKTMVLLLGIGGLMTSVGFGQVPQAQNRSPRDPEGGVDVAIAAITERLGDQDAAVRQTGVLVLQAKGPKAKAAIPALAELLRDEDRIVRIDASLALADMGPEAVTSLVGLLCDEDAGVRKLAVRTLGQLGAEAKAAVPAITERLGDPSAAVRQAAVSALQAIGPQAKAAIPALAQLLRDEDQIVGIDASHALVLMGPDAVPSVTGLLHDADARVRKLAMRTLQQMEAEGLSRGFAERR